MTTQTTRHDALLDTITRAVKATKRRADLPQAVADALVEADLDTYTGGVTVYVADPRLSPTHTVETAEGVVVEHRQDAVLRHHFPASAVVEVATA
jgi:hypothetical protein